MKKSTLSLAAAVALAVPALAAAQAQSPLAGNLTIASDYRFRGISQTYNGPAIQGGIDYASPSGVYLGNWNSNVSSALFSGGSGIEMDFYGGWKKSYGDFGIDIGTIYYYYPNAEWNANMGSTAGNAKFDNWEVYFGANWKWLSGRFFYALTDYFGLGNEQADGGYRVNKDSGAPLGGRGGSNGTWYLDLTASVPLTRELSLIAHYGVLDVKGYSDLEYSDWKLGVTYDLNGWILGAAYVDSDAKSEWYYSFGSRGNQETGKGTVVLSVSRMF